MGRVNPKRQISSAVSNRATKLPTKLAEFLRWLLDSRHQTQKLKLEAGQGIEESPLWELAEAADLSFSWAELYELPFPTFVFLLFAATGWASVLLPAESADEVFDRLRRLDEATDDPEAFAHLGEPSIHLCALMLGLGCCGDFNLKAVSAYSSSINALVERVRQGNDASFFKAVRIDPSVIQAPTMARRLAFAQIQHDRKFLSLYRSAINKGLDKRREVYADLRLIHTVLGEIQHFGKLSRDQIHDVVVNDLRLYGKKDSDTFKNLFALMDTWKRESTK